MTERHTSMGNRPEGGRYEIRLAGHLDARWAAWFDGLTVGHDVDGTTLISGPIADQAALHGVIQRVRDLGLPLLSVTRDETHPATRLGTDPATAPTGVEPGPSASTTTTTGRLG